MAYGRPPPQYLMWNDLFEVLSARPRFINTPGLPSDLAPRPTLYMHPGTTRGASQAFGYALPHSLSSTRLIHVTRLCGCRHSATHRQWRRQVTADTGRHNPEGALAF